jgi:hypothetical protein
LKSKKKKLITTFAFDEICELDKNDDVIRKLKFISSIIIETRLLYQFDIKVISAKVDVRINVKKVDKKTSTHFFAIFANQHNFSQSLTTSL